MNMKRLLIMASLLAVAALFFVGLGVAQEEDAEGCKDSPMFSRMKSFYISNCESNFDEVEFTIGDGQTKTLEGQKTVIAYQLRENVPAPSDLQIKRNFADAIKSLGGSVVYEESYYECLKLVKGGKEIWVAVETYNNATGYQLTILELGEMAQEVTANDMFTALNKDGYMALYINFDTGKSDIKPESLPVIDQIVTLLMDHPDLKLSIEGHTDNVGDAKSNKVLSEQRAKSVVAAIVSKGINSGRLSAVGWGQEKPVADNRTEDGRAKNRRVEIVRK
jgi:outer membrane protein OmpA-like peptidoglycan-associated protein